MRLVILIFSVLFVQACNNANKSNETTQVSQTKDKSEMEYTNGNNVQRTIERTEVKKVSVEEAIELANQGYTFIDLRWPKEIAEGKIEGAREMNVKSYDFIARVHNELHKDGKYILYCESGVRSDLAAKLFSEIQYTNVVDMTDGYSGWVEYHNK